MAGAGAGSDQPPPAVGAAGTLAPGDRDWRDWAGGLPADVLEKVAGTLVAQNEAEREAELEADWETESVIEYELQRRQDNGNCLFPFAMVCTNWRKAQLKVGRKLCTRYLTDVLGCDKPGRVAMVKWALAMGCPRENGYGITMAHHAARYGHSELVKWLCGEGGFAMDAQLMSCATESMNLELMKWLRGEGCPWYSPSVCQSIANHACFKGCRDSSLAVLRWARENGALWKAAARDQARRLGYTDDFGNLVDDWGNPVVA